MKQGDTLVCYFYNAYGSRIKIEQVLKYRKRRRRRKRLGIGKLKLIYKKTLVYADDIALVSENEKDLKQALIRCAFTCRDRGLKGNTSERKAMHIIKNA
jgi:hypothetical protein